MGDLLIDNQSVPSTPAAGKSVIYVDSTTKRLMQTDDGGATHGIMSTNCAVASQTPAASDVYITNSDLLIPSFGQKVGQLYRWTITLSKTAAGTATTIVNVRIGTARTTADTARLTLTQAAAEAQSALVASGIMIVTAAVRVASASGVIAGAFGFTQTYQATAGNLAFGGGNDAASSTFDNTALAGQYVGLSINFGASSAYTLTSVYAELIG